MIKLLYILILATLVSCLPQDEIKEGAVENDIAPQNYNPTFLTGIRNIKDTAISNPKLLISRIDPYSSDKIKMFVQLTDNNKYLTGANDDAFKKIWCEVIDSTNGEAQSVKYKVREKNEKDNMPIAFAMVMDHSGSMGEERAIAVQNAVEQFIVSKRPEDAVALIKYDARIGIESQLELDKDTLLSRLKKNGLSGFGGYTAINDGVSAGVNELSKADKKYLKVVVVFTDGVDNSSKIKDSIAIEEAVKNNVMVCAVDYGNYTNIAHLQNIASKTSGIYQHIYMKEEFEPLFKDIYLRLNNFYVVEFEPESFGDHNISLKLCLPDTTISISKVVNNEPLPGTLTLLNVYFDVNKATIQKTSEPALKKLFKLMNKKNIKIDLQGHTDSTGSAELNLKLSKSRADAVKNELVKRGISADRITAEGFGDTRPVESNLTEESRQKNRRTEFRIKN
ncbi:MAG: OmpA family protein [Candidatus Kapabacteria bacterium]|nr:OmpA family protein [Candidatus Kapabacteria bacterium]